MNSISSRSPLFAAGRKPYANLAEVVPGSLELLVAVVGGLGLIHDSPAGPATVTWLNLHSLFGFLLWLSVVAHFHRRLNRLPRMRPSDMRAFARHLSHRVYLLLYGLMLLNLSLSASHAASRGVPIGPTHYFQPYLACGIFALIAIHLLTAFSLRFVIRGDVGNGRLTYFESASPKRQG